MMIVRLTLIRRQRWEFINVFTGVLAIWNAEAKLKIKTLQKSLLVKVTLNHAEFAHWFVSYSEFYSEKVKNYKVV